MRVGVVVRMEADTDIDEKFAEVRAMGMESCQLVCWERKIINDEKAAEAILAAAEKHGITISAFWCGWGGRDSFLPCCQRILEMVRGGCPFLQLGQF